MGATVKKGVSQPQNGFIDGVLSVTTEATTYNITVKDIAGYANVTSIIYAQASVNSGAALTTAPSLPIVQWTTTDSVIKVTAPAALSTATIGIRFVGQ